MMEGVSSRTQVVYNSRDQSINNSAFKSGYELDLWQEVRKRWMVVGVLLAMSLAVLAPRLGAPGGFLHSEYVSYLPLWYIYFAAGRTRAHAARARLYALTALHAQLGAAALCAVAVSALAAALDRRVIEGAMLASVARPCAWLPLSLSQDGVTPALAAVNYAASFVLSPLVHLLLCGRIPIPLIKRVFITIATAFVPFTLGTLAQKTDIDPRSSKVSALVILYTECCQLLREAEGSLYITDVMATLFLVISWLTTVATSSYLYVKCGMLTLNEAHALLLVSTPKSIHIEWISATLCTASGLARLPAVFIAPAQALLLAAITGDDQGDDDNADDGDSDELPR
ncbi:sodium/bile acid cotransporter 7-like [Bicyclus anynana]|uniref:Sodium/bile acid cotransporter 7-like n=1 Tax=Bicyclus anynana TaxID=110368 RepID=A0A6J1NJT0_BICAN|nr:sodium/bile acid cotransporter 7-like [Bicyclus anynana]